MEKVYKKFNGTIMQLNPMYDTKCHPHVHLGICATLLELRNDIEYTGLLNLQSRKKNLKSLLISEFLQEDKELRAVDRAYINTQP